MDLTARAAFAGAHWLGLWAVLLAAYGAGTLLMDRCPAAAAWPRGLRAILCIASGLGLLVLLLLAAGVAGLLGPWPVGTLFLAALLLGVWRVLGQVAQWRRSRGRGAGKTWPAAWFPAGILVLLAALCLLRPLQPPVAWDELMYHLPQARLWAETGHLTVDPWIRFPLFPSNFHLLYTASLLLGSDVLPHLIHGAAAALVAGALALAGSRWVGTSAGVVAALLFLWSARWCFDVAYAEAGLTLFVAASFLALALWHESKKDAAGVLAAFLLGLAVGTKYHALLFVPVIGTWIALMARRPATWFGVLGAFAMGCAFWYVRSLVVSGDPVHPMGGNVFGHWLWDREDLATQWAHIRATAGWPRWYLLPGVLAPFLLRGATAVQKALCASGLAALALWLLTSRYERYLTPAYPLLALMSGVVLVQAAESLRLRRLAEWTASALPPRARVVLQAGALLALAATAYPALWGYVARIPGTAQQRDAFLRERLGAYGLFRSLPPERQWRLYQLGFEGEIYYSPVHTVGDWFGPARYRHVFESAGDPAALAEWLRSLGLNGLVVHTVQDPFKDVPRHPDFEAHFERAAATGSAALYSIRPR